MYLKSLQLNQFKNHCESRFSFSNQVNCFVGDNGVGKTNILDSIFHLCIGKSYFNLRNDQIINKKKDFMLIEGDFICNDKNEKIVCSIKRGGKKILKRNNKAYKPTTYC